jgi:hypothetical protein
MQPGSTKVAAIALANKTARTIWALMTSGERYRRPTASAPGGIEVLQRARFLS